MAEFLVERDSLIFKTFLPENKNNLFLFLAKNYINFMELFLKESVGGENSNLLLTHNLFKNKRLGNKNLLPLVPETIEDYNFLKNLKSPSFKKFSPSNDKIINILMPAENVPTNFTKFIAHKRVLELLFKKITPEHLSGSSTNTLFFTYDKGLKRPNFKTVGVNINSLPVQSSPLPVYVENTFLTPSLIGLKNFSFYSNELLLDESYEETYETVKSLVYLHFLNSKNVLSYDRNSINPISYAQVFDNYRGDFYGADWYLDNDSRQAGEDNLETINFGNVWGQNDLELNKPQTIKINNPIRLRGTTKNALVAYNAIHKVFRARFDEGRSNVRLEDFSNSHVNHLFFTAPRTSYESLLGKNTESFFTATNYNNYFTTNFNEMYTLWNTLNTYFIDIPFLLSTKSDPARYLWFDWQSK